MMLWGGLCWYIYFYCLTGIELLFAAIDLMRNVQVQAILGLQTCTQADFVIDIGHKTQVPIISSATSPSLSPKDNPYFIRGAHDGSSQVQSLAAIVKAFSWREVVLIYEDTDYGRGIGPYLADSLLEVGSQVRYRSIMSLSATDDHILKELHNLKKRQTRVFVVHMLPSLASRLFLKAQEAGMMNKGYAWIITDGLTSRLDSVDPKIIGLMQGVIGVKPYVPNSSELQNFTERWRKRFRQENPNIDRFELNMLGLWAYDSAMMLAMAVDSSGISRSKFKKPVTTSNLADLAAIGSSEMGPRLLQSIKNTRFQGLSGEFNLVDGQLQPSAFQIVNVIGKGEREIGFWTRESGISKKLILARNGNYTTNKEDLGVIWPGESNLVPKGWEIPTDEYKLRVGVPANSGFPKLVKVETDSETNVVNATGFCIDVFKEVIHSLPYVVPYDFVSFKSDRAGSYDDLVHQIFLGNYDAVVGDVTILANRARFADFTLPFMESSVAMVVRMEDDERKNAWIFMKPLKLDLWLTTGAFFIFTGFVVWVLEHRVNKEFRGPCHKQVGMIFWFSFSTLVFAHSNTLLSQYSNKVCKFNVDLYLQAFPKGSPLVPDVSRAILNVTDGDKFTQIQRQLFPKEVECAEQDGAKVTSGSLNVQSFKGLFLVAATSSSFALILFLSIFLYDNRVILASNNSSLWQKLIAMTKNFDKEKENTYDASKKTNLANEGMAVASDCPESPSRLAEWIFIPDEGFATTETNTPIHETIEIVETSEER
ncbi:hypothetical protein C3L33_13883, partial [Rhododendron williamsianum]